MSRLRTRLEKLERQGTAASAGLLPRDFWPALWGDVELEEADPATRNMLGPMMGSRADAPDTIEEAIRLASVPLLPRRSGGG
jgi:hypothetical protein